MKNILLMGVFAMLMTIAWGGQSAFNLSVVSSAVADDVTDDVVFNCPGGLTSCYRADGSEYVDVNALEATASGGVEVSSNEDGNSDEGNSVVSVINVVHPQHFRSF